MPEREPFQNPSKGAPRPHQRELIQLTELAVRDNLPPHATEDDMYAALDRCGMDVDEIFEELDNYPAVISPEHMADVIQGMLFQRYNERLDEVAGHRIQV